MTLTLEEVARYCPEDWEVYKTILPEANTYKSHYKLCVEQKAQARKERDKLKQALEKIKAESDCESVYQEQALSDIARIAEQALASINKDFEQPV